MQASIQQLLDLSETLNGQTQESKGLIGRYQSEIGSKATNLMLRHAIDDPKQLKDVLEAAQQKDRLMYVGIVGRVKAGKSSLLNALFFEGQNVLPSAATPMTAALTTLSYGDTFAAEVDFYSEHDISLIEQRASEYEQKLRKEMLRLTSENREKAKPQSEDDEFQKKIQRMAARSLKSDQQLEASYDQFQRMQASGLGRAELVQATKINATDIQQLKITLFDYVGASGRFMPFTKSVNIQLPLDSLRDICVVDTPGFNDPVQSREARTHELLKSCDVIFIVSPAGQFLSEQDLDMMGRITQKEGVQEIFVVASQVDTQLFGTDIRQPILKGALDKITQILGDHMVTTLKKFKKDQPEIGNTFDQLIINAQHKILYASGISHALAMKFQNQSEWSDGEQTVWRNLMQYYPDSFVPDDVLQSLSSLNLLANVAELKRILSQVRQQKDQIKQAHLRKLIADKHRALLIFTKEMIDACEQQAEQVSTTDIADIQAQIKKLGTLSSQLKAKLDPIAKTCRINLRDEIQIQIKQSIEKKYEDIYLQVEKNTSTESVTHTVEKAGAVSWLARKIWGGGSKTIQRDEKKIMTNHLYTALEKFISNTMRPLQSNVDKISQEFEKNLSTQVLKEYRNTLHDDSLFNEELALQSIENFINQIPKLKHDPRIEIPEVLNARGTLQGNAANEYEQEYTKFTNKLKYKMDQSVDILDDAIERDIPEKIAEPFCLELKKQMEILQSRIINRRTFLNSLRELQDELELILAKKQQGALA